jgi:hypothetical protein
MTNLAVNFPSYLINYSAADSFVRIDFWLEKVTGINTGSPPSQSSLLIAPYLFQVQIFNFSYLIALFAPSSSVMAATITSEQIVDAVKAITVMCAL